MFDINGPEGFYMRECIAREDAEKAFKYICAGWNYHDACEHFKLDADAIAILDKMIEEAEM